MKLTSPEPHRDAFTIPFGPDSSSLSWPSVYCAWFSLDGKKLACKVLSPSPSVFTVHTFEKIFSTYSTPGVSLRNEDIMRFCIEETQLSWGKWVLCIGNYNTMWLLKMDIDLNFIIFYDKMLHPYNGAQYRGKEFTFTTIDPTKQLKVLK